MSNKFHEAFEPIRASEEMKRDASEFVLRELSKKHRTHMAALRFAAACCAALLLVACGAAGYGLYTTPVSYISVDINPSLELGLNRMDRVVSVTAYNDDGALLLQNIKLKNKPYTEAVELLLADEALGGYLAEDALLSFTVVSDREEALLAGIQQCHGYAQANAQWHCADTGMMEEAHHSGMSVGKYQAYLELAQYDNAITAESCKPMTMGQIHDRIREYAEDDTQPDDYRSTGNGHHGGGHHGGRQHAVK